ncbi:hypothetical protein [Streptomyces odontomachi]|uniref:hypothetical protein n=1 Tax=Streptomyces odontomachi TaxID=2944940 RepID=UPI00210CCAA5|nr:hypothetical protein [Streptomyces sp. ODS25]
MNEVRCTYCGTVGLAPGALRMGYETIVWRDETPLSGLAAVRENLTGRTWQVDSYRCPSCGHLELFSVTKN